MTSRAEGLLRGLNLPRISASPNFTLDAHSSVSYNLYAHTINVDLAWKQRWLPDVETTSVETR